MGKRFVLVAVGLPILVSAACSTNPRARVDASSTDVVCPEVPADEGVPSPEHALAFNRRGAPTDTSRATRPLTEACYDKHIERIVTALKAQDRRKVLVFVHGGLNQRKNALKRAAQLERLIEEESDFYPLFVVWRSSLRSSYFDHLFHVRQGKYYPRGHAYVVLSPFYLATDLLRGIGRAPIVWASQLKNLYRARTGSKANSSTRQTAEALTEENPDNFWEWGNLEDEVCEGGRSGQAARIGAFVVTLPTKAVLAPFIDAMGKSAWDVMKRRTLTLFRDDEHRRGGYAPRDEEDLPECRELPSGKFFCAPTPSSATGSLARFLHRLSEELEGDDWEITLAGHSMGAIVINGVVEYFGERLPIQNLVYMASADTLQSFEDVAIPHLERNAEAAVYHLALGRKAEVREVNAFDLPPRGSLLVWLDDYLDDPQITEGRTAGRINNLLRIAPAPELPDDVRSRIHFKAYGHGKCVKGTHPRRHGAFSSSFRFWKPECWEPATRDLPAADGRSCFVPEGWGAYVPSEGGQVGAEAEDPEGP